MRALQVILKQEVTRNDAIAMIDWMENDKVTKYLNESADITTQIRDTIYKVNIAFLTHHFNRNGSFYIICNNNKPIGFLKIVSKDKEGELVKSLY